MGAVRSLLDQFKMSLIHDRMITRGSAEYDVRDDEMKQLDSVLSRFAGFLSLS